MAVATDVIEYAVPEDCLFSFALRLSARHALDGARITGDVCVGRR